MSEPTGADRIAQALVRAGCQHVFGIPGGEVLDLVAAFERAGLRFVLTRHETAAVFCAEGAHHATGAPGVVLATVGPGVANLANGLANALLDRVPILAITGCVESEVRAHYTHQIFDHRALLGPITKASLEPSSANVAAAAEQAVQDCMRGPRGPVHIDVPIDVARAAAPRASVSEPRLAARAEIPESVRAALRDAERPLMVLGVGALGHGAAVNDFAEHWDAPVLTTYKAKGVIDEREARSLSAFGLSPRADAILAPVVRNADVVLAVGYDPVEVRRPWTRPFGTDATVIALSSAPETHDVHRIDHALVGDVSAMLSDLRPSRVRRDDRRGAAVHEALAEAFAPGEPSGPGALIAALAAAIPEAARVSVDTGAHRILLSQMMSCTWPRQLVQSSGLCTMGCALPLAIGAKLAEPDRPMVAIVGDGGLEMVLGELATARDLELPIAVVAIDDRSLALIEKKQRARGLPNAGVDTGGTDFARVAQALGGASERVDEPSQLGPALARALARESFSVLHCPIPRRAYDGAI